MRNLPNLALLLTLTGWLAAQPETAWFSVNEDGIPITGARLIQPDKYAVWAADLTELSYHLDQAPQERSGETTLLALPRPDGELAWFEIETAPVMAPELAARYPSIHTYRGRALDDPDTTMRCGMTGAGFHAIVLGPGGTYYVDPYQRGDESHYVSYFTRDYRLAEGAEWQCEATDAEPAPGAGGPPVEGFNNAIGDHRLTYRLALACTGEYAAFHGGTVTDVMNEFAVALNRVNAVYERDLSIVMQLVANNDQLIYLNALTDPYNNFNGLAMLSENQANIDSVIGDANYDIGHVFSTGGGGIASLGAICFSGFKARGVTGLSQPVGDPFYIDFVSHEMGHQFGANHTFNGTTGNCSGSNRNGATAVEPGSGSTIMAYAGICGAENLQNNSDDYFHTVSYEQIVGVTRFGSGQCAQTIVTGNTAPTVEAGPAFTIPQSTPFELTGSAMDAEDPILTYCWEQIDRGAAAPPNTDDGTRPIFRSFRPNASPVRPFPRLSDILDNTTTFGESLPTTDRILEFRLTVRDNHPGSGGVFYDEVDIEVDAAAGPFLITAPNATQTWDGGTLQTVTWDVAGTDGAPVGCTSVDLLFSFDGGMTFPRVLESGAPNNGSAAITAPNTDTTAGRVKAICSDNIFFDINDADLVINSVPLICTVDYFRWLDPVTDLFVDANGNAIIDIQDFISCLFLAPPDPAPKRLAGRQ